MKEIVFQLEVYKEALVAYEKSVKLWCEYSFDRCMQIDALYRMGTMWGVSDYLNKLDIEREGFSPHLRASKVKENYPILSAIEESVILPESFCSLCALEARIPIIEKAIAICEDMIGEVVDKETLMAIY